MNQKKIKLEQQTRTQNQKKRRPKYGLSDGNLALLMLKKH
jgi:hypothetical protein